MSDFETRLREVLDERSGLAPQPYGLAEGARRRLRRRRTTWALAAAAVVAAAVPVGLSQLGSEGTAGVADEPVATSGLPPGVIEWGYRAESWHDVTFEVPVDWGYGGTSAWCTSPGEPEGATPVITRPDTIVPLIACTPGNGFGVTIGPADSFDPEYDSGEVWQIWSGDESGALYPDGAWLGQWYDVDSAVTVVTPDRALTQKVVDSVEKIDRVDPNECPVRQEDAEAALNSTSDSFSICRYDEQGMLTASRRLIGEASQEAQNEILSSPIQRTDYDCAPEGPLPRTVLLQGGGYVLTVITDATCEGNNGVFFSGVVRVANDAVRQAVDLTRLP